MVALPLLHVAGFLLAFLAGGLLAGRLRLPSEKRRGKSRIEDRKGRQRAGAPESGAGLPAASSLPAMAPPQAAGGFGSTALDKGLVFGHEMKNYLCAIRGNARLLRQGALGLDQAAIIDRIDRVLEKLESFEWKEQHAPDLIAPRTRECIDLALAARGCSRIHFSQSGADFPCDTSDGMTFIQGDPHRLEQVFSNLYRNALEAGATRIHTRFRKLGNEIEVVVEDNGRGCPAETAKRIFEPFFSTKLGRSNRGLGLFIVQSIVENHGGRIRAVSRNGRGNGQTGLAVSIHFPAFSPLVAYLHNPEASYPAKVRVPIASGA